MTNLKQWFRGGCLWYTFISLFVLLCGMMFSSNANNVSAVSFLCFFPCGLCLSAAGLLLHSNLLNNVLRLLFHYLITLLSFVLFLWLPSGTEATPSFLFFFWLLFTAVYALLQVALHILRSKIHLFAEK